MILFGNNSAFTLMYTTGHLKIQQERSVAMAYFRSSMMVPSPLTDTHAL